MAHVHGQDHDHHSHEGVIAAQDGPLTHYQIMETALRELLIEKGVFTADDVRREVEIMEGRNPGRGARMIARAWVDPAYKQRLLTNANEAAAELGFEAGAFRILVMENTPTVHNLIVCTLCSCYPRTLLGLPPAWYKSLAYRSRAVREPRTVLPDDVEVRVHDSTADMRYMVMPMQPAATEGWSEDALAELVTRDSLIGVARVVEPT